MRGLHLYEPQVDNASGSGVIGMPYNICNFISVRYILGTFGFSALTLSNVACVRHMARGSHEKSDVRKKW